MKAFQSIVSVGIVVLLLLAAAGWAAWSLMADVPPDWARAWALLATVAAPVAGWVGYRLGLVEARGRMTGIGEGLSAVVGAAVQAVDLRGQAARSLGSKAADIKPSGIELPQVEFVERSQPQLGAGGVVEV